MRGSGGCLGYVFYSFVFVLGLVLSLWFWFWFGLGFVLDERDGSDMLVNVQC